MASKSKIRLGVNIDHVATLRQVRGGTTAYPDLLRAVKDCARAGADQITIHLREDRRHIQDHDLKTMAKHSPLLLNLEMGATSEMVKIARKQKPDIVCLVPEKRQELTTEGGLNVADEVLRFKKVVGDLTRAKIPVSMFIEADEDQVQASFGVGAVAVEFHTGKWVHLKGAEQKREWQRLVRAAELAHSLGLRVHAGHGLDFETTEKICRLPYLEEVNIGHFLICDALHGGLGASVAKMVRILKRAPRS